MTTAFIAWVENSPRAEALASGLGSSSNLVSVGKSGKVLAAPLRYVRQSARTWRRLEHLRPDFILVQTPPIFAALLVFAYARRHGAQFALDTHSSSFLSPKWRWSLPLHRFLSRRAVTTIVPNRDLERTVEGWGAPAFRLGFTPTEGLGPRAGWPLNHGFHVAVVSTASEDEPLDAVFEAAERLPEATFHVTGDPARIPASVLARRPDNCRLTGFLTYENYIALLDSAHVVMDLTTRDQTVLMGGFEAVSVGTPLITSDTPTLREYFSDGTLYVRNTPEGVSDGVERARQDLPELQKGIVRLRQKLRGEWDERLAELRALLAES